MSVAQPYGTMWFGKDATIKPLGLGYMVSQDGKLVGLLMQTDQIPPVIKGKYGEITVWVATDLSGKIIGIEALRTKETPAFFKRIKADFYTDFVGKRPALDALPKPVSGATVSSKAIITDVKTAVEVMLKEARNQGILN